jgi:hypothetical protein
MDAPILSDYHKYLLARSDNPPAYISPAQDQPSLPQVIDRPPTEQPQQAQAPNGREWSGWDKALQGAFAGMSFYDALDTNHYLRTHPEGYEENPLLGRRPSSGKLLGATALGQIAHGLVTNQLPQPWRRIWQLGTMGLEGSVIAKNSTARGTGGLTPIIQLGDKL